ncbi:uncharacterized protein LOC135398865 [Ornithodoros turicata]|uniref:uncharacterized protein LOC135398865 n=1 Tax=Ornithodoros turicata TaxID=34597 RepID=UPI00313A4B07
MSHAAGLKLLRKVLNSFTVSELRSALDVELEDLDFNNNPPSDKPSKPEIVACVLDALDAKGPDDTFSALSKIHCWYLRKKISKVSQWKIFRIHSDSLDRVKSKLKDVSALLRSVESATPLSAWDVRTSWELEDSAVYCCFALRDLPKRLTSRVVYLMYLPDIPFVAMHSATSKVFDLARDLLERALPNGSTFEAVRVPRTDLPSTFRFCLRRLGITTLSSMQDVPDGLKPRPVKYSEPECGPGIREVSAEGRLKRKRKATSFFGPDELPVLKRHRRELIDEDVSVTIKSRHVLEDLRQLYIRGDLRKLDKHFEDALQGEEVVKLRERGRF